MGVKSIESLLLLQQEALLWGVDTQLSVGSHWRRELETVIAYQLADKALICSGKAAQAYAANLMIRG